MFLLQKVFQKSKRLSDTNKTPENTGINIDIINSLPRSTVFDATRSLRADALPADDFSATEIFSPVVAASSAEGNRRIYAVNHQPVSATALSNKLTAHLHATNQTRPKHSPEAGYFFRPPSPTVIEECLMDGALMSGQPDVTHSILSACNDLPPLPDSLAIVHNPRYMPTDPSPFTSPVASHFPRKQGDVIDTLRLGGLLKLAFDGQEFMARVTEIRPADSTPGPPRKYGYRQTMHSSLHVQPVLSGKAWCADDHINPVQKWVDAFSEPNKSDDEVIPGQERSLSNAAKNLDITPAKSTGARIDASAPSTSDLSQSFTFAALLERPATKHPSAVNMMTTKLDTVQLMGSTGTDNIEGLQTGQDSPPPVTLKIARWRHTKINPEKTYQCGGVLGKGSFAKVYLVLRTRDKRQFAMKIHDLRYPMHLRNAKSLLKELRVQQSITGRPFLSGMIDIWYSSAKFLHVITEYCPGGDLLSHVGKLTDKQMLLAIAEIVLGLISLHEKGFIHQDIKPDNILIDGEGHCVISDFGLSTVTDARTGLSMARQRPPGGTPEYMAPEVAPDYNGGKFRPTTDKKIVYWDNGVDYYGLGATIFHLQTGELITHYSEEGWKLKLDSPAVGPLMVSYHSPSSLITLVEKFTRFDRTRRWKGPRVKEADYFKSLNSSATGWYEIYAKKYAPFRSHYATPIRSDTSSQIGIPNDARAGHTDQSANINDLMQALRQHRISVRNDDSLMPEKDFIPRTYPDHQTNV